MSYEFVIKKRPKDSEAIIFSGKQEITKIKKHEGFSFKLIRYKDKQEWTLSNIVDGQRRPFSYAVRKAISNSSHHATGEIHTGEEVFVIRNSYSNIKASFTCWQVILRESLG